MLCYTFMIKTLHNFKRRRSSQKQHLCKTCSDSHIPGGCCVARSLMCVSVYERTAGWVWRRTAVSTRPWSHSDSLNDSRSWERRPRGEQQPNKTNTAKEILTLSQNLVCFQVSFHITCSSLPCRVQHINTLSSLPCKERSRVTSKLVQRGTHLIWTKVRDINETSTIKREP